MPAAAGTQQPPPVPTLVPQGAHAGQRPMTLNRLFTLIGSAPSARLYLPSKSVSRCHAVVINTDTGLFIRDLASRTQVLVNGRAVKEADLREGDVVQIGPFSFRFSGGGAAGGPKSGPPKALPKAALRAEGLSESLPVDERVVLIGRRESADVSLTENSASSAHAVIVATEGAHVLRDLNSRTGTFVNGVKIHEQLLSAGDVVRVGETTLRYVREAPPQPPAARSAKAAPKDEVILDDPADLPVERIPLAGSEVSEPVGGSTPGLLDAADLELGEDADSSTAPPDADTKSAGPGVIPAAAADAGEANPNAVEEDGLIALVSDAPPAADESELAAPSLTIPSPALPSPVAPSPAVPSPAVPLAPPPNVAAEPQAEPAEAMAEASAPAAAPRPPVTAAPPKRPTPPAGPPQVQRNAPPPPPPLPVTPRTASPGAPKSRPAPPAPQTPPAAPARTKASQVEAPPGKGSRKGAPPPRTGRPRSPFDLVGRGADLDPLADALADDVKPEAGGGERGEDRR